MTAAHAPRSATEAIVLFAAALVAGTLNSVAGGGSFVSFPALLIIGIPPINANATSTAALWPGTIASSIAYRGVFTPEARRLLLPLLLLGLIGGVIGARILLETPQTTFMKLVPWLLLGATLLFASSRRITRWIRARSGARHATRLLWVAGALALLGISIYVGYFGAGAGILLLALLGLLGLRDIHAMNGMKTLIVSAVNGVALIVFISARMIYWPYAGLMVAGAALGGYGGAYYAQKVNPEYVRRMVIVVGFAMSAYFFIRH